MTGVDGFSKGVSQSPAGEYGRTPRAWLRSLKAIVLGLQCKTTVLVVGVMLLTGGVMYSLSMRLVWGLINRLEHQQSQHHAELVAARAAPMMERHDFAALRSLVGESSTGDPLWFVTITDATGAVLAAGAADPFRTPAGRTSATRPPPVVGTPVARRLPGMEGTYLDLIHPVVANVADEDENGQGTRLKLLGYIHLGINRDPTLAEFQAAADVVTGLGIAIVLMTIPVGFFVVRRLVVPINELSHVARCFSSGDLRARSRVKRADEIGNLATNFNRMADQVEQKHREITTLNEELESRVQERTSQLRELATRDPLTGLYNRRHLNEVLTRRFAEARRYGQELSLMMIDLDDFKVVNDRFGHQAGDQLLVLAGNTIAGQLRAADVVSRFGGDEFLVLLPQSNSQQARFLGQRIAEHFDRQRRGKMPEAQVSLSIGVASLSECQADDGEALIRKADRALYEAKAQGKNCIVAADAMAQ